MATADMLEDDDRLIWWQSQRRLHAWKEAVRIPPFSAAAERIFILLAASIGPHQEAMLEDQLELSVILQYNHGPISML